MSNDLDTESTRDVNDKWFTDENPLGPLESPGRDRALLTRFYHDGNRVHAEARRRLPSIILGRKGSGKSALLLGPLAGAIDSSTLITLTDKHVFAAMGKAAAAHAKVFGATFVDHGADIWISSFWHVVIGHMLRTDELPENLRATLDRYIASFDRSSSGAESAGQRSNRLSGTADDDMRIFLGRVTELLDDQAVDESMVDLTGRIGAPTVGTGRLGDTPLEVSTHRLEQYSGEMQLTLPAMMAISGAALGPVMGRYTVPRFRPIMALLNIRLGVWIPNPRHRYWRSTLIPLKDEFHDESTSKLRKRWIGIRLRWREPGALYVMRDALGLTGTGDRFIQVADGGHWDNLGLLELLRLRCTEVICFDSSGATGGLTRDLAQAVSLARSQLHADVVFDPTDVDRLEDPNSNVLAIEGMATFHQGARCRIILCRAKRLTDTTALDVREASQDKHFPHHSLLDQFYDDARFEAYRALGREAAKRAIQLAEANSWGMVSGRSCSEC